MTRFRLALISTVCAAPVMAADQQYPRQYTGPWWHDGYGFHLWWIFPLTFFVLMIVMLILMMRRGGMGCMWGPRMMDRTEAREAMRHYLGEPSESALNILDKRYAKGEIDKREYEEKKADLTR